MKPLIPILLAVVLLALPAVSRRTKTPVCRKPSRATAPADSRQTITIPASQIEQYARDSIIFSGFDKPLDSTRETFFATNKTSRTILSITLRLQYTLTDGRHLHADTHTIPCEIPPGETMLLTIPSWDRQKSYYYASGNPPRRRIATPFLATATLLTLTLLR